MSNTYTGFAVIVPIGAQASLEAIVRLVPPLGQEDEHTLPDDLTSLILAERTHADPGVVRNLTTIDIASAQLLIGDTMYGDPHVACCIVQWALARWAPQARVTFEFADASDALAPSGFGGGRCLVSAAGFTIVKTNDRRLDRLLEEDLETAERRSAQNRAEGLYRSRATVRQ